MSPESKDLHIVFRNSGRILIDSRMYYEDHLEIYNLVDDLSIGPIGDLNSKIGVQQRKEWLGRTFGDLEFKDQILAAPEKDGSTIELIAETIGRFKDVYIWTGVDTSERIATARILNTLSGCDNRLFVLDLFDNQFQNIYGDIVIPGKLSITASHQVGEVTKHFRLQNTGDLKRWRQLWNEVCFADTFLRISEKKDGIVHKQVSWFDPFLLTNVNNEYQKAARVIGLTLVDIYFAVGDNYLNWRLKELSHHSKLDYKGQLREIKDYEVRLSRSAQQPEIGRTK